MNSKSKFEFKLGTLRKLRKNFGGREIGREREGKRGRERERGRERKLQRVRRIQRKIFKKWFKSLQI